MYETKNFHRNSNVSNGGGDSKGSEQKLASGYYDAIIRNIISLGDGEYRIDFEVTAKGNPEAIVLKKRIFKPDAKFRNEGESEEEAISRNESMNISTFVYLCQYILNRVPEVKGDYKEVMKLLFDEMLKTKYWVKSARIKVSYNGSSKYPRIYVVKPKI